MIKWRNLYSHKRVSFKAKWKKDRKEDKNFPVSTSSSWSYLNYRSDTGKSIWQLWLHYIRKRTISGYHYHSQNASVHQTRGKINRSLWNSMKTWLLGWETVTQKYLPRSVTKKKADSRGCLLPLEKLNTTSDQWYQSHRAAFSRAGMTFSSWCYVVWHSELQGSETDID